MTPQSRALYFAFWILIVSLPRSPSIQMKALSSPWRGLKPSGLSLLHSHVLHWVSARHTLRLNWIELNWDWDLEAIIEGIYFFLDEKRRQDLIYLYGKLSRAGWYTQMARCSWECEDRVRETEWNRRLRSWHPGANISSGRTQSPPHCACACSSEASAEAEGWCYFDHQAVFSECPWLIPLLLLLMDSILNGKSLLEK